jgi:hypothetical protein
MILRLTPILLTALALSACDSSTVTDAGTDAGTMRDDAPSIADAPSTSDAPSTGDAPLPATAVTLTYRSHTENVPRAVFGYVRTDGVITQIYLELSRGGDDGCPSESSATPDQILTVSGYLGTELGTQDTGIMTAFFDFEGSFREEIAPAMSTAATVELLTLDQEAGTATGNVDITFDEGSAIGGFSAVHCDSLDTE